MEVRVTKCKNGHYYDANKHTECPHCGAASVLDGIKKSDTTQKKGLGLFKKKNVEEATPLAESYRPQPPKAKEVKRPELQVEDIVATDSSQVLMIEDVVTEGCFSDAAVCEPQDDEVTEAFFEPESIPFIEPVVDEECEPMECFEEPEEKVVSLKAEIESVKADNDAKTVGFFSMKSEPVTETKVEKTYETAPVKTTTHEPVVGWLVCLKGRWIGQEFKLVTGRNSIGRSESNSICLSNEGSVSREKHAWIVYEPRKRQFFIQPGESSGLTYVNDDTVLEPKQLSSRDILEFGDTKFIFIPLCGETFSWNEYFDKE